MMYLVYAVAIDQSGEKNRHFLDSFASIEAAKHLANCATLGSADYAYVKEIGGSTVFSIGKIRPSEVYEEGSPRLKIRPPAG